MFSPWQLFLAEHAEESDHQSADAYLRGTSLSKTLKKVLPLCRALNITRLSDISQLDCIGLPVVSAIRPQVNDAQITATQGKGTSFRIAIVSALMEAVERYSAANYISPLELATETSLLQEKRSFLSSKLMGMDTPMDQTSEWVTALALHNNQAILLPASDVLFPYYPKNGCIRICRPSTTGLASGNTLLEALQSSLNEVIERDAVSKFLIEKSAGLLDQTSILNSDIQNIIKKIEQADIDLLILDLSMHSSIPAYYVSLLSHEPTLLDIACAGQGTHILPEIALKRALLEAVQSRAVAIQGGREDLIRHATEWNGKYEYFKEQREKLKAMAKKSFGVTAFVNSKKQFTNVIDALNETYAALCQHGYTKIYMSKLTHSEINIPTVHTIIQGMVDNIVDPNRKRFLQLESA
jgi:YcaO-like protein with predicted kinase domain